MEKDEYEGDIEIRDDREEGIGGLFSGMGEAMGAAQEAMRLQKEAMDRIEAQLDIPTKEGGFIKVGFDLRLPGEEMEKLFRRAKQVKRLYEGMKDE